MVLCHATQRKRGDVTRSYGKRYSWRRARFFDSLRSLRMTERALFASQNMQIIESFSTDVSRETLPLMTQTAQPDELTKSNQASRKTNDANDLCA
ncbi:permease of the major facilitator superfamily [Eggerthella sp. YY7918]|nr:permease of the major facilitator superfamily [Eggerthella sp. YY7918]